MKTFEEAFQIVRIPHVESGPSSVEIENMSDLARTIIEHEPAQHYFMCLVHMIEDQASKEGSEFNPLMSLVITAFAAGVRVGQEMEKTL